MNNLIKNDFKEFEKMLFFITIVLPFFHKIPKIIFKNNKRIIYWELKLSQYTNWNILIILLNCVLNYYNIYNNILLEFITVNSISICITFHLIYLNDYNLIYIFPKTNDMSFIEFHLCSFITHILPVIYFLYKYNNIEIEYQQPIYCPNINIGIYTLLFKLLWCFTTVKDFEVAKIYSKEHNDLSRTALKFSFLIHYFTGLTFSMLKNNY